MSRRKQAGYADLNASSKPLNISRAKVFMCSSQAARAGVYPGMRLTEAQAQCSHLIWRQCEDKLYIQAQHQLIKELVACSPRVSVTENGVFLLDASGLERLGGESKLCRDVLKAASRCGYVEGRIGVADSAFAALVASRHKTRRWLVVPPRQDQLFLRPLTVDHLPLNPELRELLHELGIKSMGELAALPAEDLSERFAVDGKRAHELARGIDDSQPSLPPIEQQFITSIDVGGAIESLNDTLFLFKSMLDRLSIQLKQRMLCADELSVSFFNDNDKFDQRTIQLIKPANGAKFLVDVIRLTLESKPLMREFTALEVLVTRVCNENWQQPKLEIDADVFSLDTELDPMEKESALLLLQRFRARVGEQSLVCPAANDEYFADNAGVWLPVLKTRSDASELQAISDTGLSDESGLPITVQHLPANARFIFDRTGMNGLSNDLVIKRISPPESVMVRLNAEGRPLALTHHGQWHHVMQITAPECLSGHWWQEPVRRSSYVVLISRNQESRPLMASLIHDSETDKWLLEGLFD